MSDQKNTPINEGYKPVSKGYMPQNEPSGTTNQSPPGAGYQPASSQGSDSGKPPVKP